MANPNIGRFVWYDFLARDPKKAIAFYTQVMGWKTQPFDARYTMFVGSQGPLGGVGKLSDEATKMGAAPHWVGAIRVEDVDATAALVKKLGGKEVERPADITNVGRHAVLADPQGAVFAVFKPEREMQGHDASKEGEMCWNELMTSDPAASVEFHGRVFGWKQSTEFDMDSDKGKYRTFGIGDQQFVGIMKLPDGLRTPPMWIFYTETKDLEAAIGRAKGRGATLLNGPMEVPGGGNIAQLMDPEGALFAFHRAPR